MGLFYDTAAFEKSINKQLLKVDNTFKDQMAIIAEKVMDKVIRPFCKKYKLNYYTGNNGYWFSTVEKRNNHPQKEHYTHVRLDGYYCMTVEDFAENSGRTEKCHDDLQQINKILTDCSAMGVEIFQYTTIFLCE